MSVLTLQTGVQMQLSASLRPTFRFQPGEQHLSVAARTCRLIGYEIINGEDPPAVQHLDESIASHSADRARFHHSDEAVPVGVHHSTDD